MKSIVAMNREELMHFIAYIIPATRKSTGCIKHKNKEQLHAMLTDLLYRFPEINLVPTCYRDPDILLTLYVYLGKCRASNWEEAKNLYEDETKI